MPETASHILLINPNSSVATSRMMRQIAQRAAGPRMTVVEATAVRSPSMIVTAAELEAAAAEVVDIGLAHGPGCVGIIVSAFGDPGLERLTARVAVPVVGICEASMQAAARGGRRFAVATVTPDLMASIAGAAARLGLSALFTGTRVSGGDARALAQDPERLVATLGDLVQACIAEDGAQAVIIGGGPLGEAAETLQPLFPVPVLAPIRCAVALLLQRIAAPVDVA